MHSAPRFLLVLIFLAWFSPAGVAAESDAAPVFRLMTFNIHHGEGMDGVIDLDRIATLITNHQADIVALQEVDRGTERTGRIDMPAELARRTGLTAVFSNNYHFGGGEYGNALLTRFPIRQWTNSHFHPLAPVEQRGILQVLLTVQDRPLLVANTHFDAGRTHEERIHSAAQLPEILLPHRHLPILLAGDFNATPDSAVYRAVANGFRDAWKERGDGSGWTIPVETPNRRIDYIFISKGAPVVVREIKVLSTQSSDHLPVLAMLSWNDAE